jgi:competence protein ComEA
MFMRTMSLLMVATLTLFAVEAGKTPVVNSVKDKTAKEQKAAVPSAPVSSPIVTSTKVNVNTATAAELQKLHGIGAVKAQAIVDYRKAHGAFKNTNDLISVPGIGDKIFADIKNDVKIR